MRGRAIPDTLEREREGGRERKWNLGHKGEKGEGEGRRGIYSVNERMHLPLSFVAT